MATREQRVRYAVVGQGYFAQAAVLPAFEEAKNSDLVALVSDDPVKLSKLKKEYDVEMAVGYDQYDDLLRSGAVDAVYIVLPNSMHRDFTVRAARAGVHVLCEKPMATSVEDCEAMIRACDDAGVKLMIGYRLHFEEANLTAVELAQSGKLGDVRLFTSTFTMPVKEGNIRVDRALGGGPLWDIGIYCINAARYIFAAEPSQVIAMTGAREGDPRFSEVEEVVSATLRFSDDRLATFTASFGTVDGSLYDVIGTKGTLRVEPAFEFATGLRHILKIGDDEKRQTFRKRDQIAPELIYFSDCVLEDEIPEPGGREGLADVRIIEALYQSAASGRAISLEPFQKVHRPSMAQEMRKPAHDMPDLVNAEEPSED